MSDIAIIALISSYFMLVWFRTNAFVEYMVLFRLSRFFHISEYEDIRKQGYDGNYVEFLFTYFNSNFIVRLLSCPICLSFWISMLLSVFIGLHSAWLCAPLILFFYLLFNKLL